LRVSQNAGRCTLTAEAQWVGGDLLVVLTGGDAHIGSVSCAAAGEPLHSHQSPHHRDAALGDRFALALHRALGVKAVVLCGVHVDGITSEEIRQILDAGEALLERLSQRLLAGREAVLRAH
jgi:hypothetical protein